MTSVTVQRWLLRSLQKDPTEVFLANRLYNLCSWGKSLVYVTVVRISQQKYQNDSNSCPGVWLPFPIHLVWSSGLLLLSSLQQCLSISTPLLEYLASRKGCPSSQPPCCQPASCIRTCVQITQSCLQYPDITTSAQDVHQHVQLKLFSQQQRGFN